MSKNLLTKKPLVIAVDGTAASGKGTLSRRLAAHFGLKYLDTGKLYRAVALTLLHQKADLNSLQPAVLAAQHVDEVLFDSPELISENVGEIASKISALPEVRAALLERQRRFAALPQGAILDGRDIGTVVCPNADIKLFVSASLETRANRRFKELQSKGFDVIHPAVLEELRARDARDQRREIAPLKPASDAILVDTTDMEADEVFAHVLALLESASQ